MYHCGSKQDHLLFPAEIKNLYRLGFTSTKQVRRFICAVCASRMDGLPLSKYGLYLFEAAQLILYTQKNHELFETLTAEWEHQRLKLVEPDCEVSRLTG